MAEYVIGTDFDILRVQAHSWILDGYNWFNFYDTRQGSEDEIVLTVNASIVRSIRRFEEPTEA
jgi:hypothetical protein